MLNLSSIGKKKKRNYVQIYWWQSNMGNIGWKVNLDILYLSIVIVLLDLPYLVSKMTFCSTIIEKSTLQNYSH